MSRSQFSYERLDVHADILRFLAAAEVHVSAWDRVHAVVDHFYRASEGILLSLAEASRAHQLGAKTVAIDYSLGSVLECAGCIDIAETKGLVQGNDCRRLKEQLVVIFGKQIGLRKSWVASCVQEPRAVYGDNSRFHHERLDAYQLTLQVIKQLTDAQLLERLSRGGFRRFDEPATSMVLNIAEGNGRFGHLDHQRFLEISNRAAVKRAARLEIGALRGEIESADKDAIKALLVRVDATSAALAREWGNQR